ncbi:hypothetical protein BN190_3730009 [Clostridioides difficile T14]|nr:hypothetical protein BN177_510215 [Clostridioides difficile E24]CCL47349.1 hypothetical protein BN178_750216 [Clostridioides difficile T42]CCL54430.1 hypothetical protein BN180_2160016 [Clostridioides difficile E14]CCL58581.1 hypothetical protein BN181_3630016 [Clostridioides difficile T17]CCL62113.1 hypothetical protein BN182_2460021 [Clostridioides difficile E9]CCL77422.1 hypothetical protein BN186_1840025 [Clostridioides difficile E23]CCL81257.1 hypothetical protein BN187_2780016 [Clost
MILLLYIKTIIPEDNSIRLSSNKLSIQKDLIPLMYNYTQY